MSVPETQAQQLGETPRPKSSQRSSNNGLIIGVVVVLVVLGVGVGLWFVFRVGEDIMSMACAKFDSNVGVLTPSAVEDWGALTSQGAGVGGLCVSTGASNQLCSEVQPVTGSFDSKDANGDWGITFTASEAPSRCPYCCVDL
jgi:hypothetical protein